MRLFILLFCISAEAAHGSQFTNLRTDLRWCAQIFERAQRVSSKAKNITPNLLATASRAAQIRQADRSAKSAPNFDYLSRYLIDESWPELSSGSYSVTSFVEQGKSVSEALQALRVPSHLHALYSDKGEFVYRAHHGRTLAIENGRAPLDVIHIGFMESSNHFFSRELLIDYARAMGVLHSLELIVSAPSLLVPYLKHVVSFFPKSVRARIQVVELSVSTGYSWAQDYLKPFAGERIGLVSTAVEDDAGFKAVIDLGFLKVIPQVSTMLKMVFGNVVVGDRHVFMGADIIDQAMFQFKATRAQILQALSSEVGKPVFEVGVPTPNGKLLKQPIYHIDLSIAAVVDRHTDQEVIVVISPAEFLKALGFSDLLEMTREQYYRELEAFFQRFQRERAGRPLSSKEKLLVQSLYEFDYYDFLEDELKHSVLAQELKRQGYQVLRVPGKNHLVGAVENEAGRPAFNYVNVILSGSHVLAPLFGIPELDDKAYAVYEKLGYEVIKMRSASYGLRLGGGVRCLSTTFRKPLQPK